jgi:site-specific recombinase XerD
MESNMSINEPKHALPHEIIQSDTQGPIDNYIPLSNRYQIAATSDNTRRAYQADIRHFETWGGQLPATTEAVLRYLHAFAETLNPRTLSRHITALKQWVGLPIPSKMHTPELAETFEGKYIY